MSKNKATQKINGRLIKEDARNSRSHIAFLVPCIIVVAILGILLITFWGKDTEANLVVTPDNVEEMIAALKEEDRTPIGAYEVSMNSHWTFPDGESASEDAYVQNSICNNNTVYFVIKLEETGQEIYKSPYIPVGSSLENITLDYELDEGSYETVLTYYLVDNSFKKVSEVSVGVTITIED